MIDEILLKKRWRTFCPPVWYRMEKKVGKLSTKVMIVSVSICPAFSELTILSFASNVNPNVSTLR